jgi:hypothetical protein
MIINAIKLGNIINISMDGKLSSKTCSTKEQAHELYTALLKAKENPTPENIIAVKALINDNLRIAYLTGFETNPELGTVYLAGFNTPVPRTLLEVAEEYYEAGYPMTPIINFWKLLMINPDVRIRETLFDFIKTHDFVLTDKGYMLVYKAVYIHENKEEVELMNFINKSVLKVKGWNCSLNKYSVYQDRENNKYAITKTITASKWDGDELNIIVLGKLGELLAEFEEVAEDVTYCDMHTKKMKINLGTPVNIERKECDSDPARECSYGLHVGATDYVAKFGHINTPVLACLVNPANVVSVPTYDNSKMRVAEYFPIGTVEYDGTTIEAIKQSYYEDDYTQYEEKELDVLIKTVLDNDIPLATAKHAEPEDRPIPELLKMLKSRLIDIM